MENLYSLRGVAEFTREEFLRLLKTHFEYLDRLQRAMPNLELCPKQELKSLWASLVPYTIKDRELFADDARSRLRVFFWALRPDRFFRSIPHEEVDKLVLDCRRTIWDSQGNPRQVAVCRTYTLLSVDNEDIGVVAQDLRYDRTKALEVKCPSSGSMFVLMVPPDTTSASVAIASIFGTRAPTHRHGDVLSIRLDETDSTVDLASYSVRGRRYNHDGAGMVEKLVAES